MRRECSKSNKKFGFYQNSFVRGKQSTNDVKYTMKMQGNEINREHVCIRMKVNPKEVKS